MEKGDHQSEVLYLEFPWITSGSLPALHEVKQLLHMTENKWVSLELFHPYLQ